MKIVSHAEMLAMPPGTVFPFFGFGSDGGPDFGGPRGELLGSLYVKGQTLNRKDGTPFDFQILNMLPTMALCGEIDPKLSHLAIGEREGTFAETAQYMVWCEDACWRLAQALLDPAKAEVREFGRDEIAVTSDTFELINDYGTISTLPKAAVRTEANFRKAYIDAKGYVTFGDGGEA